MKLDPANTELLAQKQKLLKDAIGSTKEKLDALKTAQEQAKQQLENGDLGQDKYDALQREIIETEEYLKKLVENWSQSEIRYPVSEQKCFPLQRQLQVLVRQP